MRRIATLVATGAVAAAAAISLAAAPANADTGVRFGSPSTSSITASAVSTKPWKTSGSSGLAGVTASGRVGWVKKGKVIRFSATVKDTMKDGLRAGLEVKISGQDAFVMPSGHFDVAGSHIKVREVLGHVKGNQFYYTRQAKAWKTLL
ncbi:hypothetical protein [Actinoallomurus sp. NPDC052274]|uniref:hypothetical protein n=1 Tax=Actinoallomurus sp. NPDC052274 TaxID=3155420 RepID=UPI003417AEF6